MSHSPDTNPAAISDLTASILARTSGPACDRLRRLACDFVDGTLPTDDRELVSQHVKYCPKCQGLVASLAAALQLLPGFARVEPGEAFSASVLTRTHSPLPPVLQPQDRLLAGWARLMRRPRAALEVAYLATAAGLIFMQVPLPGIARPAGSALISLVRTESRTSITRVAFHRQGLTRRALATPVRILRSGESAWATLRAHLTQSLVQTWKRLVKAASEARAWLWPKQRTSVPASAEPSKASPRSSL